MLWRPGDTDQNLESPGLSGRVDRISEFTQYTTVQNHCRNQETRFLCDAFDGKVAHRLTTEDTVESRPLRALVLRSPSSRRIF